MAELFLASERQASRRVSTRQTQVSAPRFLAILITLLGVAQAQEKPDITEAWNTLLEGTAIVAPARTITLPASRDFLNHFFLESRTEFTRQQVGFSGQPTVAGFTAMLNVFPGPFQP